MKTFFPIYLILCGGLVFASCNDEKNIDNIESNDDLITQRLDSTIDRLSGTDNYQLQSFHYNDRGLVDTIFTKQHFTNSLFGSGEGYVAYAYDANDSLITEHHFSFDSEGNIISGQYKIEYTRNAQGKKASEVYYLANDQTGAWEENNYKCEYTYDASGRLSNYIYFDFLIYSRVFIEKRKHEFSYDDKGNVLKEVVSLTGGVTWEPSYSCAYTYKNDVLVRKDYESGGHCERTVYEYDAKGNNTKEIQSQSEDNGRTWQNSYQYVRTFDDRKNVTMINSFSWNSTTGQWEDSSRWRFTYDSNGYVLEQHVYSSGVNATKTFYYSEVKK